MTGCAYARAGLMGNPSDGYFGKCLAVSVRNYAARATCCDSPVVRIVSDGGEEPELESVAALVDDVRRRGYYGGVRLLKASVVSLWDYCRQRELPFHDRPFSLGYDTDIPIRVGLAGSSAIVTAAMRALTAFFGIEIDLRELARLILEVETKELGIPAGFMDRVIQVYEGVVFMNLDRALMERDGSGEYERLDPALLPPLFVAHRDRLAAGSEVVHSDLRSRFERGEDEVVAAMRRFAELAQSARDLLAGGKAAEIGPLMDANFDLRASITDVGDGNRQLVAVGRGLGASVKQAGSGGAVVGTYDGDPDRLRRLVEAYAAIGARLIVPEIAVPGSSDPTAPARGAGRC